MERHDTNDDHAASPSASGASVRVPRALIAILLVALALRIPGLDESLWFDELWSTSVRLESPFALGATALRDNHPPLYSVLMYGWIHVFGESEISLRMLPLLAALGGIWATYALACTLSTRTAGLVSAGLVAVSPVHIWYAQEARPYALWTTLVLLAALAYFKLRAGRSARRWLIVHGVGIIGALLMHFLSVALAGVFVLLCMRRRDAVERRMLWINAVGLAALGMFLGAKWWFGLFATASPHLRPFDELQLWMTWFEWFPAGHSVWPFSMWELDYGVFLQFPDMLVAQLLLAALLGLGLRTAWTRHRVAQDTPELRSPAGSALLVLAALLFAIPVLLVALTLTGFTHTFIERSLIPTLPLLAVLIAVGLGSIRSRSVRLAAGCGLIVMSATGLITFLRTDSGSVYKANPDWRSAAAYLLERPDVHAPILAASPADVLAYYDPAFRMVRPADARPGRMETRALAWGLACPPPREPARFPIHRFKTLDGSLGDLAVQPGDHVYLILNEYWRARYDDLTQQVAASGRFELVDRHRAKGLRISRYRVVR